MLACKGLRNLHSQHKVTVSCSQLSSCNRKAGGVTVSTYGFNRQALPCMVQGGGTSSKLLLTAFAMRDDVNTGCSAAGCRRDNGDDPMPCPAASPCTISILPPVLLFHACLTHVHTFLWTLGGPQGAIDTFSLGVCIYAQGGLLQNADLRPGGTQDCELLSGFPLHGEEPAVLVGLYARRQGAGDI